MNNMNHTVSFARIRNLLQGLGFTETTVPGSHVTYEHPSSGTVLVLRAYRPRDPVQRGDLAMVRRFLVERGLVEGNEFESLLQETAAWQRRVEVEGFPVCHLDDIIASKAATNRVKDRESLPRLRAFREYWLRQH